MGGLAVGSSATHADDFDSGETGVPVVDGQLAQLGFYSSASQIAADGERELTADDHVVVWAEPTAENFETTADGPETVVYEDADIPLVSEDGRVVGFGSVDFVSDNHGGFRFGNEQFLVNLFDEKLGGEGTILWDEGHGQFGGLALENYESFRQYCADAGYTLEATESLLETEITTLTVDSTASLVDVDGTALTNPEYVVVWAESTATNVDREDDDAYLYGDDEDIPLIAKAGQVVGFGGVGFIADSNFDNFTEANEAFVLEVLADVTDGEGTLLWDEAHDTFWDADAISDFAAAVEDDGYDFQAVSELEGSDSLEELEFFSTASLLTAEYTPLTDESLVAVHAESTATNEDAGDSGGAGESGGDDEVTLAVDSVEAGATAEHVWTLAGADVDFEGEIDELVLEYPESAAFDGLTNDDVTVVLTRELADGVDTEEISVNQGAYDGSSATLDLSGAMTTNIVGESTVTIEGLTNPDSEDFTATITLTGDDEVTLEAVVGAGGAGSGDFVPYPDDVDIPLVAVDGGAVGIGAELAPDASDVDDNRAFLVNAWADRLGGTGSVLYDEGHGQELALEDYSQLESLATSRGFDVEATTDLEDDLADADLLMVTTPAESFSGDELTALAAFVDDGGALFLHDEANFEGDGTEELNEIAAALELAFRFNADQVVDDEHSGFAPFVPRTSAFNTDFDFFGDGDTLENAAVFVTASPAQAFSDAERTALEEFVADGGAVFLFDESEFANEETDNLNAIAEALDVPFRFNADQVEDAENNAGVEYVPTTGNFNEGFEYFGEVDGPTLSDGDGLVVMTPEQSFSNAELNALAAFVDDGGALFIFDQSDFGGQGNEAVGFDETENLNEIADALELAFRFNADQVNDEENFNITTGNFNDDFAYFDEREQSIAIPFEQGGAYYGRVVRVFDGDTFEVEFDSEYDYRDVIRHIGIDTAETAPATNDPEEWFGIEDLDHLDTWGSKATDFSLDVMAPGADAGEPNVEGRRVKMTFDPVEPKRGNYGRLLMYMHYDPDDFDADPGADFAVNYNRETIEKGYARIYSSGFSKHDEWAELEEAALEAGTGVWSAADFDALEKIRNEPVEKLFVPEARSIHSRRGRRGGRLGADRVPVYAGETAEQVREEGAVAYDDAPLVAVDDRKNLALVGGLMIHERYEKAAGFVDTTDYGNFPFLANLIDSLSTTEGDVFIAGGQGQFNAPGSISLERCQYFLRYLEGLGTRLRQVNDLEDTLAAEDEPPRAVIITAPERELGIGEVIALRQFRNDGGAVILMGSAEATTEDVANLNELAQGLNSDLRFNHDRIVDPAANLNDDPGILETDVFTDGFDLFDAADLEAETEDDGRSGRGNAGDNGRGRGHRNANVRQGFGATGR
ncbi:thermonuclease family protein [Natronobeatus ordinarius]|uniref:thermonuclease family protein n=1 Tax=Natronobeatus ordinarius TaxID=2963433 RepID=UPI0020CEB836|nr:thermonuclease family protein [Natronobeatus ordinarius]